MLLTHVLYSSSFHIYLQVSYFTGGSRRGSHPHAVGSEFRHTSDVDLGVAYFIVVMLQPFVLPPQLMCRNNAAGYNCSYGDQCCMLRGAGAVVGNTSWGLC